MSVTSEVGSFPRLLTVRAGKRFFRFRHEHLRHQDGAGRSHDDGAEQMFGLDAIENVSAHDAAGDVGHAGGHDRHQFGASQTTAGTDGW